MPDSMPFIIKICGITSLADAIVSATAGVDWLGFNFWPQSKRYVAPDVAAGIISQLPKTIRTVGVFVDSPAKEVNDVIKLTKIDMVQFHGNESDDLISEVSIPVFQAIRLRFSSDVLLAIQKSLRGSAYVPIWSPYSQKTVPTDVDTNVHDAHSAPPRTPTLTLSQGSMEPFRDFLPGARLIQGFCLVDTWSSSAPGGTGQLANHKWVIPIALGCNTMLAGGLTPDNVGDIVLQLPICGVDVASGVESAPGVKDPQKLYSFVKNAREASHKRLQTPKRPVP